MNQTDTDLTDRIEAYMQAMEAAGKFSGAVLLAHKGEVLHAAGYGLADREHGVANTPRTKFRIGSITKQFTAMSILILAEEGKLGVDDPIARHLPYCPEAWKGITIHHLLNHTSGIANLTSFPGNLRTTARLPLTLDEVVETFRSKPLDFAPGSQIAYSNSGYLLLGDIIERVSGMPYESFLKTRLFGPLEMADSGYDRNEAILPQRARGYGRRDGEWVGCTYLDMGYPHAAGALYSTVEDLYRWDQALRAGRLVGPAWHARMNTVTPLLSTFGYGVVLGRAHDRRTISHDGGIHGFRANLVRYPDEPACVVVLCNSEVADFLGVSKALSALLFGKPVEMPTVKTPVEVAADVLAAYAGVYEIVPGVALTVAAEDGRLRVESGAARRRFLPESESAFFSEDSPDTLTFRDDGLTLIQGEAVVEARKID